MVAQLRAAVGSLFILTLVTGVAYPLAITGITQLVFPKEANGSLREKGGEMVGSDLIGQPFTAPRYFWSRPSATTPPNNGGASSGSNLGPTNPALVDAVAQRIAALRAAGGPDYAERPVPVDLVTSSASGLDPHISPAAAEYQVERVAKARGLDPERVRQLVAEHTFDRTLGMLGARRVAVLPLNIALDELAN